jgi:hypothetical protein
MNGESRRDKRYGAIPTPAISLCSAARGDLINIIWHDSLGLSLYAKRLEKGRAAALEDYRARP